MQLPTVNAKSNTRRWTVDVIAAAALIICCVVPSRARAQAERPSPRGDDGRIWYEKYCTPCHGPGGGPGSAVFPDSKQPIDLRTYVHRHGGNFPRDSWLAVVLGDPVASAHSAVWEKIRTDEGTTADAEIVAHGIVVTIADYVISIQAK
jgi:hypothetical protein